MAANPSPREKRRNPARIKASEIRNAGDVHDYVVARKAEECPRERPIPNGCKNPSCDGHCKNPRLE